MNIVTIDTGITNTRATVWQDGLVLAERLMTLGDPSTAFSGPHIALLSGLRTAVDEALQAAHLSAEDIDLFLASGMTSASLGLHEMQLLQVPVGLQQLADAMEEVHIAEVCEQPIWFIPGVRNAVHNIGLHNYEAMDTMRGEEVQCMGLAQRMGIDAEALLALPGSHSKYVHLGAGRQVLGCATTLSGELLDTLTKQTILADSLSAEFADAINYDMVLAGAEAAQRVGFSRACFSVRALDQLTIYDRNARANFLLGAVLSTDLLTLKNSSAIQVRPGIDFYIIGRPLLAISLALLVRSDDYFSGRVVVPAAPLQAHLAGFGAILVARERGLVGVSDAGSETASHPSLH